MMDPDHRSLDPDPELESPDIPKRVEIRLQSRIQGRNRNTSRSNPVSGRAKQVLCGSNNTESNLFHHGETRCTQLDDCPRILLSCFRASISGDDGSLARALGGPRNIDCEMCGHANEFLPSH